MGKELTVAKLRLPLHRYSSVPLLGQRCRTVHPARPLCSQQPHVPGAIAQVWFPSLSRPAPTAGSVPASVRLGRDSCHPRLPWTLPSAHRARPVVGDDAQWLLGLPRSGKQPRSALPGVSPAASPAGQPHAGAVRAGAAGSGAPARWLGVQGEQRPVHGASLPARGGFAAAADLALCLMSAFLHTPALPNQQTPHYSCHGN